MSLEDDLLDDLNDLGGDDTRSIGSDNEDSKNHGDNMDIADDNDEDDEGDNSNDAIEGDLDEEQRALLAQMARKAKDIHKITSIANGSRLKSILEQIDENFKTPVSEKKFYGPIEEDPEYKLVLKANDISTEIGGEMMVVHKYLRDHYRPRFPELETLVPDAYDYARTVKSIGNKSDLNDTNLDSILKPATKMVVTVTISTTSGKPLPEDELQRVNDACDIIESLIQAKAKIVAYVESRMAFIAPNLSAVIGSSTAAKLIVAAGGLVSLSKVAACNIQVIGKSHEVGTGLSGLTVKKHVGYVYYSDVVQDLPDDFRTKMMRMISAKCALASRVDAQHEYPDGSMGKQFREDLDARVEKLREAAPLRAVKALPVPKDPQKKRRGGRRFRKLKEANATTELMKLKNRVQFGVEQSEHLDMDETEGMGMIHNQKGRIRAIKNDSSKKIALSKKYQKILGRTAASGTQTSGLSTSLAFTPVQGFELTNPQSLAERQQRVKEANERYFGSATPFSTAKRKRQ
ncbi:U4/U6-U5 snRNP complex subunit prp31 [Mycoemilia scoparia]|uniref:U4/U6-U5 snRNP complex subunit prp31 n=1 Tax=Mycoemilia scoparia TaxID=417184 RepID=A0A9W8A1T7_9FUNG|nr:U4/U6-U5 snRNP complex subunit prp31 [Mycoemilia scoparia]